MAAWGSEGRRLGKIRSFGARIRHRSEEDRSGDIDDGTGCLVRFYGRYLDSSFDALNFGSLVTFELFTDRVTGEHEARYVRPLEQETDIAILSECISAPAFDSRRPALDRYLAVAPPHDAAKMLRAYWLRLGTADGAALRQQLQQRDSSLLTDSPDFRSVLDPEQHVLTCLAILDECVDQQRSDVLLAELVTTINKHEIEDLWETIAPFYFERFPLLREFLPPSRHIRELVSALTPEESDAASSAAWVSLRDRLR